MRSNGPRGLKGHFDVELGCSRLIMQLCHSVLAVLSTVWETSLVPPFLFPFPFLPLLCSSCQCPSLTRDPDSPTPRQPPPTARQPPPPPTHARATVIALAPHKSSKWTFLIFINTEPEPALLSGNKARRELNKHLSRNVIELNDSAIYSLSASSEFCPFKDHDMKWTTIKCVFPAGKTESGACLQAEVKDEHGLKAGPSVLWLKKTEMRNCLCMWHSRHAQIDVLFLLSEHSCKDKHNVMK